jgi:hypothetical protein
MYLSYIFINLRQFARALSSGWEIDCPARFLYTYSSSRTTGS